MRFHGCAPRRSPQPARPRGVSHRTCAHDAYLTEERHLQPGLAVTIFFSGQAKAFESSLGGQAGHGHRFCPTAHGKRRLEGTRSPLSPKSKISTCGGFLPKTPAGLSASRWKMSGSPSITRKTGITQETIQPPDPPCRIVRSAASESRPCSGAKRSMLPRTVQRLHVSFARSGGSIRFLWTAGT